MSHVSGRRSTTSRRLALAIAMIAALFAGMLGAPQPSFAAAGELFFSEYIEGSSNNKALEIYNGTGAAVDLAANGYNVFMSFNGGTSTLTINLTGTVADGDVFVLAQSSANAAILAQADQTNGAGWFNGDDAVLLRRGTTVIDAIGQVGFDPGAEWGSGLTSTADNTLRRNATICAGDTNAADVFDPALEWAGFATDTFDGLGSHTADCSPLAPVLNEFSASTAGTDVEYVEIYGTSNTDYSAYTALEIEGDAGAATGTIDEVIPLGVTDANGLYLANLPANALENGTITLLLVEGFSGALNTDLDVDNDGVFDETPWTAIVDAVAVNDGGAGDLTYGVPALGVSYDGAAFAPGGASRIPDGVDTDTAADWVRNDFDLAGIPGFAGTPVAGEALNTPGALNQAITAATVTVSIEASDPDAAEAGSDPGNFRVSRTGDTAAALTVNYAISGSASAADYTPLLNGTIEIPAGAATADISITPIDDADVEGAETVILTLTGSAGYTLGASASATVTIADNDAAAPCSLPDTSIGAVQGDTDLTPLAGQSVTVQGVVIGDYEEPFGSNQIRGFYLQDSGDGLDATSDGVFVYTNSTNRVALGRVVQVTGTVNEFQGQTQIAGALTIEDCGESGSVTPIDVTLPIPSADYLERYEGMLVRFPQTLHVTELFQLGRFGQVTLSSGARLPQPTNIVAPGAAAQAQQEANNLNRIILDDDNNLQNPDPISYGRGGNPLSASNTLRGGDSLTGVTGVLAYSWGGNSASGNAYRLRALGDLDPATPDFMPDNARPAAAPQVGGTTTVASFNVLNYFLTLDIGTQANCGPLGFKQECRGAETAEELARQQEKLNAALLKLDADVIGLMELENTQNAQGLDVNPLADIVGRLNASLGGDVYGYVNTGVIGTDTIRVGLIYKQSSVTPIGQPLVDLNPVHNRPPVAQLFSDNASGSRFTVAVNHFKSKGCTDATGADADLGDGQGCWNATRVQQAQALLTFIDDTIIPTTGDPDVLLIGDFNSYAKEDPIATLEAAGYTNLIARFSGPDAYSYVFDGQWGYLDQGLASPNLLAQVASAGDYHINADEPSVLDYNTNFKSPGQIASLFAADEFRTSDHDPVVIGLDFAIPPQATDDSYTTAEDTPLTIAAGDGLLANDSDPNGGALTAALVGSPAGVALNADGSFSYMPDSNVNGEFSFEYTVSDGNGGSATGIVTITVTPVNDPPVITVNGGAGFCANTLLPRGRFSLTISDVDSPVDAVTLTAGSSNPANLPANGIQIEGDGAERTIEILALPRLRDVTGGMVTLTATDGQDSAVLEINVVIGTPRSDTLIGDSGRVNLIFGLAGDDRLTGGDNADLLCGGLGDDVIKGNGSNDTLDGSLGNDTLDGGAGNDTLFGDLGRDTLTGGSGADWFNGGFGIDRFVDFNPAEGDTKS